MGLIDEIREQPDVVARLVGPGRADIDEVGRSLRRRRIEAIVIAARGSSDHAAIYAQYLFGVRQRLPVALAAPSIVTRYGVEPRFAHALVVGISQSGASPDVVGVVDAARRQGAPTIAITNAPDSALAAAAAHVIDLETGPERAIAATKTYTASLAALARLSIAWGGHDASAEADADVAALAAIPAAIERDARGRRRDGGGGSGHRPRLHVHRPRPRLRVRDRPRMGAEAEGAGLRPGRSVLGGRLPARADRTRRPGLHGARRGTVRRSRRPTCRTSCRD